MPVKDKSHCTSYTKDMLKKLNKLFFFQYVWDKKSEKVGQEDAHLLVKMGWLGAPDIQKFWTCFNYSWVRSS